MHATGTAGSVRDALTAVAAGPRQSPKEANWTHAYFDLYAELPRAERQARSLAYALVHEPVRLFAGERLVGLTLQACPGSGCPELSGGDARWQGHTVCGRAAELVRERVPENAALVTPEGGAYLIGDGAAPGHIAWRWHELLERGIEGLLAEVRGNLRTVHGGERAFFEAVALAWQAVLDWNDRHVAALEAAGAETDLLALCRRVPRQPARTFQEAVQAFHFQHLAVMFENPFGGNSPGRLDRWLGPYLERDLAAGRTTLGEARALIDELFLRFEARTGPADGWVETVMVGGVDERGAWAGNALSSIVVESLMDLPQTHPAVYVRLAHNAPDDFRALATRYLLEGGNRAQILNDDAILPAMTSHGVAPEDAAEYVCGGCMELSPQGLHSDMNFTLMHSVAKTLELVLTGGACLVTGKRRFDLSCDLTGYPDFEALFAGFAQELRRELWVAFQRLDCWSEAYAECRPAYLISSLVGDCLVHAKNLHDGGARYHDYGFSPMGIANAGDSLYAIRRAVFGDGRCTAEELLTALREDFAGREPLRRYLLGLPKYGTEDPDAGAMTDRVLRAVCEASDGYRTRWGGQAKPMVFNFVWTPMVGGALGASADGRRAGAPVAHGLTPQAVGMREGLTAAINSSTALHLTGIAGGATTMWDLDPAWATPAMVSAVVRTFCERGGQILQGNTTSVADLEAALDRPADYPHLIVRVGGFSAHFVSLDRALQEEIIGRVRHRG